MVVIVLRVGFAVSSVIVIIYRVIVVVIVIVIVFLGVAGTVEIELRGRAVVVVESVLLVGGGTVHVMSSVHVT